MAANTDEHRNDSDDNSDNQPPKPKTKATSQPPEEILQGLTDQRLVDALRTVLTASACLTRLRGQLKGDDETMKPMLRSKDLTQLRALERVVTDLEDMAVRQRKERQKLLQIRLYDEIYDAYQLYRGPRRQERVASPGQRRGGGRWP